MVLDFLRRGSPWTFQPGWLSCLIVFFFHIQLHAPFFCGAPPFGCDLWLQRAHKELNLKLRF